MYALDITNLSEEQRGDLSQRLHELMDEPYPVEYGGIKEIGDREIGLVGGTLTDGFHAVKVLQKEGYDISIWLGCGHCLQDMPNDGGRCDCRCHRE